MITRTWPGSPSVKKEWRRLLARLRRHGPQTTSEYLIDLIRATPYPNYYVIRFVEHLLRRHEHEAAGKVIRAFDRARPRDPLMDDLHSTWLWCMGRRRAAVSFALNSARHWRVSYLVHKVGTVHRAIYDKTGSAYHQKKALHYWDQAHVLVRQEEKARARKAAKQNGVKTRP